MPRFALLEHDHPQLHWDFLLECGPACRTWRLSQPPAGNVELDAEPIPDHRLIYLEYAGPVSGGRGSVTQWDAGTFAWLTATEGRVSVLLNGRRSSGRIDLVRIGDRWRAIVAAPKMPQAGVGPA